MTIKLKANDKEKSLNDFVESILDSTTDGAVITMHGENGDWKKVDIEIEKSNR